MNTRSLKLRLHYFPFSGRAAPIRDALNIGGVTFEDVYIPFEQFRELKAAQALPFGALPMLEVDAGQGLQRIAQSNAILRLAGRLSGLYPEDDVITALKIDEILDVAEDINNLLGPSMHEQDKDRKLAMRRVLLEKDLPMWLGCIERLLIQRGNTGYLVGKTLTIADLKMYWVMDMLTNGSLDGIPVSLLEAWPAISAWFDNIAAVRTAKLGGK